MVWISCDLAICFTVGEHLGGFYFLKVSNTKKKKINTTTLEKEMATHSSILAWEIPWTEESGGLQSMGSQKRLDTT